MVCPTFLNPRTTKTLPFASVSLVRQVSFLGYENKSQVLGCLTDYSDHIVISLIPGYTGYRVQSRELIVGICPDHELDRKREKDDSPRVSLAGVRK